jgi:hypothetical protein
MKDTDSAFPVFEEARVNSDGSPCTDYVLTSSGMTLRQYAAIHLKVPRSGDADIDAMIRDSLRAELAGQVIGFIALGASREASLKDVPHISAETACAVADVLLAELEKEATK